MKKILFLRNLIYFFGLFLLLTCTQESKYTRPNIVFIMIDDLGYGDIGCYGSKVNNTPNIDKLAEGGKLFTDFHSNGPMCSPTRAALMTGRYQHRLGKKFERAISGKTDYDDGMPTEVFTIAEMFKSEGYATGMFGKWHLGYHPPFLPSDQGFDEFVGLAAGDGDHFTHIDRWGRKDWWHNDEIFMEGGYTTDLITKHSLNFISKNKENPFFLYVSHLSIHFPWQAPTDPPQRIEGREYTNDKWGIIPDKKNVAPHVKGMVESVDQSVGGIMNTLKELELLENTLVIFTSDNGGYTNYGDSHFNISSNGQLRGQKTEVYEGGHRVPFIAYWSEKIDAASRSDATIMTMDMFPTFATLIGNSVNEDLKFDGINILPQVLFSEKLNERVLCWKMGNEKAVRKGNWKLCMIENNSYELYDLSKDIGEKRNLASKFPQIVDELILDYTNWEKDVTSNYD